MKTNQSQREKTRTIRGTTFTYASKTEAGFHDTIYGIAYTLGGVEMWVIEGYWYAYRCVQCRPVRITKSGLFVVMRIDEAKRRTFRVSLEKFRAEFSILPEYRPDYDD